MSEVPNIPWNTISTDLFSRDGKNYLIIADCYTKYPIVEELTAISSRSIAEKTLKIFSMFGIPNTVISDNGPQFTGKAYQELMRKHGIAHITSSPHHPQSHGFIERMIRMVKGYFYKSNPDDALLAYRATPLGPNRPSPAQLMFNRKIQTNLPAYIRSHEQTKDPRRYMNSPTSANQKGTELPDLHMNQPIFHQDVARRTWSHGTVVGIGPAPRSYTICCKDTGRLLCRNRVLLRPRSVSFQEECSSSRSMQSLQDYSPLADLDPPVMNLNTPNTEIPPKPATVSSVPTVPPSTLEQPHAPNTNPNSTPTCSTKSLGKSRIQPEYGVEPTNNPRIPPQIRRSSRHIKKPERLIESYAIGQNNPYNARSVGKAVYPYLHNSPNDT